MLLGEVLGWWLWGSSSDYVRFVGAMVATGCAVAALVRMAWALTGSGPPLSRSARVVNRT